MNIYPDNNIGRYHYHFTPSEPALVVLACDQFFGDLVHALPILQGARLDQCGNYEATFTPMHTTGKF